MIRVSFYYDEKNNINGFCIKGHAGYRKSGEDIICSAVSVLSINTANSIEIFTDDKFECKEDDGFLDFRLITVSDSSVLLLKSFKLGIEGIVKDYGKKFIRITN